jgi:hypothetical protein
VPPGWKSEVLPHLVMGTRRVQADSGSDSDSESRNKNEEIIPVNCVTPTVCTDPPEPATTIRTCTVKQRTFFAPVGAKNVLCLTVCITVCPGRFQQIQLVHGTNCN